MKKILYLYLFLMSFCYTLVAQERGNLFIHNYLPKKYNAHIQNWAITQTNTGIILVGNGDGILYQDGSHFNVFLLPNKTTVRSFAKSKNGTIYIGSVGHFGYLEIGSTGQLKYHNLAKQLDSLCPKFFDIWGILATPKNIYFRATNLIFRYNLKTKKIFIIKAITSNAAHFSINNKIYVKESRKGIYRIENDSLRAIPNYKQFIAIPFVNYYPINKDSILITSRGKLYFIFQGKNNLKYSHIITSSPDFIAKTGIYSLAYKNNLLYLGTDRDGVIILNKKGSILKIINSKVGLLKGAVYNESFDSDGNLWLAMSNGFSFINLNSPVSFWNEQNGIEATVEDIIRFKGDIFIASHQDFYHLNKKNKIQLLGNVKTQTWDFQIFKIPHKNDSILLAASTLGLHEIEKPNILKNIWIGNTIFSMHQWKHRKNIVFLGLGNGFTAIRYDKGKWIPEKHFLNIKDNIRAIEEDKQGNLWLGTFRNGAIKIQFKDTTLKIISAKYYNKQNGFQSTKNVLVYPSSKGLVFVCEKGIYHYNKEKDSMVIAQEYERPATNKQDVFNFQEYKNNEVYISGLYNKNTPLGRGIMKNGTYKWDFTSGRAIPNMMALGMYCDSNGKAWLGGSQGLYLYNPDIKENYKQAYAYVSSIRLNNDSLFFSGFFANDSNTSEFTFYQNPSKKPIINYKNNSLTFNLSSTIYYFEDKQEFSYKLLGFEKKWSKWTTNRQKQYTNLPNGDYTFELKAKDIYHNVSKEYHYQFTIEPPFYLSIWAYIFYVIFAVVIIWLIVLLYSRRLIKQKEALEKIVEQRTLEIREQNQEITLQNAELMQAKEEIMAQAELLELTNTELEKLSIVASETSNAVSIFNENLELEWVNAAFERIYGYSQKEFVAKFGINLLKVSSNAKIKEAINECISSVKPIQYESFNRSKSNKKLWMQVTLSPILGKNGSIRKIIAIESDISMQKIAEEEIKLQNEEIKTQNELLQESKSKIESQRDDLVTKNMQIEGSINYGLTIQQALLPTPNMLNRNFDNFILYRPRDIVSGDFYWFSSITISKNAEYQFLAVIDCTGHGVPGAFMSMIANRLLAEVIIEHKIYTPSLILKEMDATVKKTLKQDLNENNDGMDMSIIRIDKNKNKCSQLIYAGAKRPILHYKGKKNELELIPATRKSIGGSIFRNTLNFVDNYIAISQGDRIYQYSDGYIDQNAPNRKRFGTKRFLALVNEIKTEDLLTQKSKLEKALDDFQKNENQRDDITIVAIEIGSCLQG